MKKKHVPVGNVIDRIERFCREEGWQVKRVSNKRVDVVTATMSTPIALMITLINDSSVQIAATIDQPLPPHRKVLQCALPDPSVTLSPTGCPTWTETREIILAKLDAFVIDEMLVGALVVIGSLFEP